MPKGIYPRTRNQRRASSRRMRTLWKDPAIRTRWSQAASERLAAQNRDPAFKTRINAAVAASNRSPQKKAKIAATRRKNFHVPPPLAKYYRKLRIALGKDKARVALREHLLRQLVNDNGPRSGTNAGRNQLRMSRW